MRLTMIGLILLAGCSSKMGDGTDTGADAGNETADASTAECAPKDELEWSVDVDGDGFGDGSQTMSACAQPEGYVYNDTDCDDTDPGVHPDAEELCDEIDNDCDPVTEDICPSQCSPRTLVDGGFYLFCAEPTPWTTAQAVCTGQAMELTRIDSQAELDSLIEALLDAFGGNAETWIGANDEGTEGNWQWIGGEQFWQGNGGGSAVGGLFNAWRSQQPDNANSNGGVDEDCAIIEPGGLWDDKRCSQSRVFICEKYTPTVPD